MTTTDRPAWAVIPHADWNEVVPVTVLTPLYPFGFKVQFADGTTEVIEPARVRAADNIDNRYRWSN